MTSKVSPNKVFSRVSEQVFDHVGRYNPQLLREWQGRLRWRNLLLTVFLSLIIQAAVSFQHLTELPMQPSTYHRHCVRPTLNSECVVVNQWVQVDWPLIWANIFRDMSFVLVWVLIIGGVYLLAADLAKESRRGTLNFLRMSPQPGRRVLLGKLLGVPILLYLGIGMMIPLHFSMGLMASYPLSRLVTFYGLLGAIAFCFYAAALWFAIMAKGLQGFQTWLIAGLSGGLLLLGWNAEHLSLAADWFHFFYPLHHLADWEVKGLGASTLWPFGGGQRLEGFRNVAWFFLPIGRYTYGFWIFSMVNASVLGLWFWAVLERKFQMPTNTTLSKRQSYGLTLWLSLIVMGFELQSFHSSNENWGYPFSMLIWSMLLLFLLLPSKQLLLDWTRYRHQPLHAQSSHASEPTRLEHEHPYRKPSLLGDLAFHNGSPLVFAFAINLALITGVLLFGMSINTLLNTSISFGEAFASWLFIAAFLIVCAFIVQFIALSNMLHWRWIAFGSAMAMVFGFPILLIVAGVEPYGSSPLAALWLMTAFPQAIMHSASLWEISIAMLCHTALLFCLSTRLIRRCQVLGQSEWKALMTAKS